MAASTRAADPTEMFETMPVSKALMRMAIPTIISQLVTLFYNVADSFFIGRADTTPESSMVAASSLVLTVFMLTIPLSSLFGSGGGSLVVRLLGAKEEEEAGKVASYSLGMSVIVSLAFSLICLIFMDPLLRFLGANDSSIVFAKQYLLYVVVIGGVPTVVSHTMSTLVRNVGHSREAGFGLSMGGLINVALDPLFMFVIMPDGYEVMGAAIATMLSNVIALIYFIFVYKKLQATTVLSFPKSLPKIQKSSLKSLYAVGVPAALSPFFFDIDNMVMNRLAAGYGDPQLAAMGIILKVERLPLNIDIGISLAMMPLVAYNYASKNFKRMRSFFTTARTAGVLVALGCIVLYRTFAAEIMSAFLSNADTAAIGTEYLKARCLATPFMFLSFQMVNLMQAVGQGKASFYLSLIRHIILFLPVMFILNYFFGMMGIVYTQIVADIINVITSYIIYWHVNKKFIKPEEAALAEAAV